MENQWDRSFIGSGFRKTACRIITLMEMLSNARILKEWI